MKSSFANAPKRSQRLRPRQIDGAMAEATFDTLLQALHHIEPCCQSEDRNGRFPGLSNVEKIVEERLPAMSSKEIKLIDDEDDGCGGRSGALLCVCCCSSCCVVRSMREKSEERDKSICVACRRLDFTLVLIDAHLTAKLAPDVSKSDLVVGVKEGIESDHVESVVVMLVTKICEHRLHQRGFGAASSSNDEHRVAFAGDDGLLHQLVNFLVFVVEADQRELSFAGQACEDRGFESGEGGMVAWIFQESSEIAE